MGGPVPEVGSSGVVEPRTYFVEESLGRHVVPCALRAGGLCVERLIDHLPHGVEDRVWIEYGAAQGWILLTKDGETRFNVLERDAIVAYRAHVICASNANASGDDIAKAIIAARIRIEGLSRGYAGKPLYCRLHRNGSIEIKALSVS